MCFVLCTPPDVPEVSTTETFKGSRTLGNLASRRSRPRAEMFHGFHVKSPGVQRASKSKS